MEDDEEFLSQIAAAEADAIINSSSSKRRRFSNPISEPLQSHPQKVMAAEAATAAKAKADAEGAYTAALKGSKSHLWQQQQQQQRTPATTYSSQGRAVSNYQSDGGGGGGTGNDTCFKCGKSGHWARDCVAPAAASATTGGGGGGGSDSLVPEKACSCGLGTCLVLTANTEKNRGRKFYRCPIRQENGGCGFFEWCDNPSGANIMNSGSQNYASNSTFPDLPCPCGAGSCLILTAKTGKNVGQQFYRCPANQESSCGHFKWCSNQPVAAGPVMNASNSKACSNMYETSSQNYGAMSASSCFKCGKQGHWAKDCSVPSSGSIADSGGRSASSGGTCYKCGKPGHWAKDCSPVENMNARQRW